MDRRRITGKYMAVYTATFAVLCAVVFLPFALAGKSLIGNGDGQSQYILQLAYMGRWLREALAGFLHGDFTPACYDLAIGMGDGLFFLLIGTAAGLPLTLLLTVCTFCLSAVWSLGVIVTRQVRGLPRDPQFIPLLPFTLFPALLWCVQSGVIAGVPA